MPGIFGIIANHADTAANANALEAMSGSMMHEPFYISGKHIDEGLGVWAGSIAHKGSFSDCSPIWNDRKDICLLFSGETVADKGDITSARYLLGMYEKLGIGFLKRLNGWFSGLLLDLRSREVILFNDRYGLGRIYCSEGTNAFYFASEAKALLRVLPAARQFDLQSFGEFLSCGCALQNRTLFRDVSLLPGGVCWRFQRGSIRKESYFSREEWESQEQVDDEVYYQELKETLTRIAPKYLVSPAKIGLSLTGGLDSRMVLAAIAGVGRKLQCYTFSGMYRECADAILARRVAKVCGLPHEIIRVDRGFLEQFRTLAERAIYVSDGAMDVTGSVELYANRIAREIAPIRVTGNYGSEILRANVAFSPRDWGDGLFARDLLAEMKHAKDTYRGEACGHQSSFIAFKQVPWHHCSRLSLEQCELTPRSPFLDNELVKLTYRASARMIAGTEPSLRFIAEMNPALARISTDRGLTYPAAPGIGGLRRFRRALSIKAENAFDGNMPQWLASLTHTFRPIPAERLFIGRNRFYHFRPWFRDELAGTVREILLDERALQRSYLERHAVERAVQAHTAGNGNYGFELTKLLSIELIQRELLERSWN